MEDGLTAEQQEAQLYEAVLGAILGTQPLVLKATVGLVGDESTEVELKVRWPDLEDEEAMERRTAEILVYPADSMSSSAITVARARAMIEVLAVAPFPQFLHATLSQKPVMHKGEMQLRPDTSKLRSKAVVAVLYQDYNGLYNRFQYLAV